MQHNNCRQENIPSGGHSQIHFETSAMMCLDVHFSSLQRQGEDDHYVGSVGQRVVARFALVTSPAQNCTVQRCSSFSSSAHSWETVKSNYHLQRIWYLLSLYTSLRKYFPICCHLSDCLCPSCKLKAYILAKTFSVRHQFADGHSKPVQAELLTKSVYVKRGFNLLKRCVVCFHWLCCTNNYFRSLIWGTAWPICHLNILSYVDFRSFFFSNLRGCARSQMF